MKELSNTRGKDFQPRMVNDDSPIINWNQNISLQDYASIFETTAASPDEKNAALYSAVDKNRPDIALYLSNQKDVDVNSQGGEFLFRVVDQSYHVNVDGFMKIIEDGNFDKFNRGLSHAIQDSNIQMIDRITDCLKFSLNENKTTLSFIAINTDDCASSLAAFKIFDAKFQLPHDVVKDNFEAAVSYNNLPIVDYLLQRVINEDQGFKNKIIDDALFHKSNNAVKFLDERGFYFERNKNDQLQLAGVYKNKEMFAYYIDKYKTSTEFSSVIHDKLLMYRINFDLGPDYMKLINDKMKDILESQNSNKIAQNNTQINKFTL